MERYAILGWGASARAAYRYLVRHTKGEVRIYLPVGELSRARAEDARLPLVPDTEEIREDVLVRSPGIRPDTPAITRARGRGARLTSEAELFISLSPAPIFGVTGSDGKTTTATLAAHMLETMGYTVYLGGNIGVPLLDRVEEIQPCDRVVLELSSFQLMEYTPVLYAACVTNISENHLNWHTDMREYISAKENILRRTPRRAVNARVDCPLSALTFSAYVQAANYHLTDGVLMHGEEPLLPASEVRMAGLHNIENILAAAALTEAPARVIRSVATTFTGVEYRMTYCGTYRGVCCYDSSIDTTPTRTAATLSALPKGCTAICGGAGKNLSYRPLAEALSARCAQVVFTGDAGGEMQEALVAYTSAQNAPCPQHLYIPDFTAAVDAALAVTPCGGTLVLTPAATSFDAFSSYRARGDTYRCRLAQHNT